MSTQSQETQIDINSSEELVDDRKVSTYENILEFFENYIKPFYAFKDDPTYKAVISFFIKYYIDIIYNVQPEKFKELYEEQIINIDVIDLFLVSIGLPQKLIKDITTTSKLIIMKSFSDFERYKGTIKFFRSIGGAFSDVMSYYELYIDYDETYVNPVAKYLLTISKDDIENGSYILISSTDHDYYIWFNLNKSAEDPEIPDRIGVEINYSETSTSADIASAIIAKLNTTQEFFLNVNSIDVLEIQLASHGTPLNPPNSGTTQLNFKILEAGKGTGGWILRPRPVYIHPKTEQVTEVFSYQEAYNKIPTLLVPEEQLEELKSRDELVIPTKSNIILLDYTQTIDSSPLNKLFFTIIMEHIGDDYFSVFLTGSSGTMTISYNTAFFLWYYLLAKYYGVTLEGVDLAFHNVMGTKKITPFTVNDIPRIEEEYNNLQTRKEIYAFYQEYIEEPFTRLYENEKPTLPIMSETLRKIDSDMWDYVENRIATAENVEQDIRFLLDELYASMVLSFDRYKDNPVLYKYIPLLLQFSTQITTNIKVTDSYKLVYNLKPFHTEILDLARNKILVDDKFNSLGFEDNYYIMFLLVLADLLQLSDQANFRFSPKQSQTSINLISTIVPKICIDIHEDWKILINVLMTFFYALENLLVFSDTANFRFEPKKDSSSISFISTTKLSHGIHTEENLNILIKRFISIFNTFNDLYAVNDKAEFKFIPGENTNSVKLVSVSNENMKMEPLEKLNLTSDFFFCLFKLFEDFLTLSDKVDFKFTPGSKASTLSFTSITNKNTEHNFNDEFKMFIELVKNLLYSSEDLCVIDDQNLTLINYPELITKLSMISKASNQFSAVGNTKLSISDKINIQLSGSKKTKKK